MRAQMSEISGHAKIKSKPRSLFLFPKVLFNVDIRQNFTLEEGDFEKQK